MTATMTKPARVPRPRPVSDTDIVAAAEAAYGAPAKVFDFASRNQQFDGSEPYHYLAVDGRIIGRRRSRSELLQLARRGPIGR